MPLVQFEVTQEDIDEAIPGDINNCLMARCIGRAVGQRIGVGFRYASYTVNGVTYQAKLGIRDYQVRYLFDDHRRAETSSVVQRHIRHSTCFESSKDEMKVRLELWIT